MNEKQSLTIFYSLLLMIKQGDARAISMCNYIHQNRDEQVAIDSITLRSSVSMLRLTISL
jgi:hypothetical protein